MRISLIGSSLLFLLVKLAIVSSMEVYWNIPSFMCKKHKIHFDNTVTSYGIRQNRDDNFQGNEITILYDPGAFPALGTNGERRNGGVPQEGNLTLHLNQYKAHIDELVPDVNNNGLIIIDFESWRPIFRQNFGVLKDYKDLSYRIERERHPFWTRSRQEAEAQSRFEAAGKRFVEETLALSKSLRPRAQWGYYAFPYCFNKGLNAECPREVRDENDKMEWMFSHSHLVLPSVYLHEQKSPAERQSMVKARIKEAQRVSKNSKKVYVYIQYVYPDSKKLLSESDLIMVFQNAKNQGAKGVILWGSSNDLKTRKDCEMLQTYLDTTMGPISQSFSSKRIFVDMVAG
ncbi:hypothetical protein PVAND_006176 [Polypedilum vanderplanki]|uniref:Hyaluronidase n=1 Tax=Polypedilum vanderplanki TaxID=319348 RepID=A0A9J6C364_POLVA|nr:hypothetical protein PVAND_006176 [Polypedilum vanderplanki]